VPQSAGEKESAEDVTILYTNYRGEKGWRKIRPIRIWFGRTEWHPASQWLLDAWDVEKDTSRSFAIQDIHEWKSMQGEM
jgi:predicted DNA-binding transcriptional regulator YafY